MSPAEVDSSHTNTMLCPTLKDNVDSEFYNRCARRSRRDPTI